MVGLDSYGPSWLNRSAGTRPLCTVVHLSSTRNPVSPVGRGWCRTGIGMQFLSLLYGDTRKGEGIHYNIDVGLFVLTCSHPLHVICPDIQARLGLAGFAVDYSRWCQGREQGLMLDSGGGMDRRAIFVAPSRVDRTRGLHMLSCHLHIVRAAVRFVEPVDQGRVDGHTGHASLAHIPP